MIIRVLVVDDSAVVRRLVSSMLDRYDDIDVVGQARNGEHALTQVAELAPDAVVMDLEMPVMGGIEAVRALRRSHAHIPVLVFSSATEVGSRATIDALVAGAVGYVHKGRSDKGLRGIIEDELLPKLREVCARPRIRPRPVSARSSSPARSRFKVLALGTSTGGPSALAGLLPKLPLDLDVPVLIVQHMPPQFTRLLAVRLDQLCFLPVREAADGDRIEGGTVYIAPGGYHMRVRSNAEGAHIVLDQGSPVHACRPAVDPLFVSVAEHYGDGALVAILTGMGRDGCDGCRAISKVGGTILAQDERSSVVWGMPRAVVEADLADEVVSLSALGSVLCERLGSPAPARRTG